MSGLMSRRRVLAAFVSASTAAALAAAGCSSDGANPTQTVESTQAPSADTGGTSPASGGPLEGLLAMMTAEVDERATAQVFLLGDVDGASAAAGVTTRPAVATATDDDIGNWMSGLSGWPGTDPVVRFEFPRIMSLVGLQYPTEAAAALGWSVLDVHRYIQDESGTLTVLALDSDPDDITAAIGEPTDGVWAIGDDGTLVPSSAERPDGSPVRMGWSDGHLAYARDTAVVQAWLAADEPTLADNESFVQATRALDSAGAYYAVLLQPREFSIDWFVRANPRASEDLIDERLEQLVPNEFDALAIGQSAAGGTGVTTFVYHHADAAAAAANAPILEELFRNGISIRGKVPFSEMFTVQSVETEGSLVTVTVTGQIEAYRFVVYQENMVAFQ